MAKLTLTDIASLQSETTALQALNANFEAIEAAMENTFSRDGTTPNQLEASLDANSKRIINLPTPTAGTDAARFVDIQEAAFPDIVVPSLTGNDDKLLSNDGTSLIWSDPAGIPGLGDMLKTENLAGLASLPTSRGNLGLGSAAVANVGTSGDALGKLNVTNTWSASQSFTALLSPSGGTTFSGTGDVRLNTTPTVINTDSVGFRGAPQNSQDATYTLVLNDAGKTILHTVAGAHTWTIPPNSSVAFPLGTSIVVHNTGAGAVTIARGSGVALRIGGSATDANRSLAQYGLATLYKSGADSWYITGSGVS